MSRNKRRRGKDSYDSDRDSSYERRRRRRRRSPSNDGFRSNRRPPPPRRSPDRLYRFDSPPKDQDNVMNAMAAAKAVGGGLADAQNIMQSIQTMSMAQASKVDRKLYVGNLPPSIAPKELVDLVNHALLKIIGNNTRGDPVISAWIASDGHYAFLEFRSPDEANYGFALNNISIHGHTLKVGRPNTYNGVYSSMKLLSNSALMLSDSMLNPEKHAKNVLDAEEDIFDPFKERKMITETAVKPINPYDEVKEPVEEKEDHGPLLTKMGVLSVTTGGRINPIMGGTISSEVFKIELPSRVLVLKDIIKYEYVAYQEDYDNLIDDLKKELVKHGMVVSIKIPHYAFLQPKTDDESKPEESKVLNSSELDLNVIKSNLPPKQGFGNAYVEYVSEEEAKNARRQLIGRKYDNLILDVIYHSLEKYERDDFSLPGVITTGKEDMGEFEGMQHLAIEFNNGAQSSVQDELRNFRKYQRENTQYQLAIGDKSAGAPKEIQTARVYRKDQEENKKSSADLEKEPVVKEE